MGGAPKIGDRAAWINRVKLGLNKVYESALKGHAGMPARGGMADLSDVEVKRAVEYMMNSGAGTPVRRRGAGRRSRAGRGTRGGRRQEGLRQRLRRVPWRRHRGRAEVRRQGRCGRRASRPAWTRCTRPSIKGKGVMPPKGGNVALSDADVKAAVDYMVAASK